MVLHVYVYAQIMYITCTVHVHCIFNFDILYMYNEKVVDMYCTCRNDNGFGVGLTGCIPNISVLCNFSIPM